MDSDIDRLLAFPDGLLVVALGSREVAWWSPGTADWSWVAAAPRGDFSRALTCGDLLFLPGKGSSANEVQVMQPALNGLPTVSSFRIQEDSAIVAAWQTASGERFLLTTAGLHSASCPGTADLLQPFDSALRDDLGFVAPAGARAYMAEVVVIPEDDCFGALLFSTAQSVVRKPAQCRVDGCAALWDHYLRDDRPAARRLLQARVASSSLLDPDGTQSGLVKCFDATPSRNGFWFVTSLGVVPVEAAGTAPAGLLRVYTDYQATLPALLTWELWLDADGALDTALTWLLRLTAEHAVELGSAVAAAKGRQAAAVLLGEFAAGKRELRAGAAYDGMRALFGALGWSAAPLVEGALESPTAAVAAAGAAAAGATNDDGEPLLWSAKSQVPVDRLAELLAHEAAEVRCAAADSIKMLRPPGMATALEPLLADSEHTIRVKAVQALSRLPDVPRGVIDRCAAVATVDMNRLVREWAVGALAKREVRDPDLDVFLAALADIDPGVRSEASYALEQHARSIEPARFPALADSLILLELCEQVVERPVHRAQWGIIEKLGDLGVDRVPDAARALSSAQRDVFASNLLLALLLDHTCEEQPKLVMDRVDQDHAPEVLEVVGSRLQLTAADLVPFTHATAPLAGMARLIEKLSASDRALAQRMAVLFAFRRRRQQPTSPEGVAPTDGGAGQPLHIRLRELGSAGGPFARVAALADAYAALPGLPGNVALLARAVAGDQDARFALGRKAREGELDRWPVLIPAVLALFRPSDRTRLASAALRSARCSPLVLRWIIDQWSQGGQKECPPLPDDARATALRAIAGRGAVPLDERLAAARELRDLGDPGPLVGLAAPLLDSGRLSHRERYLAVSDLVAEGRAALFPELRGRLRESPYDPAVRAFALYGTVDDIPELQLAMDAGAPEELVRSAIQAVQARSAGGA